MVTVFLQSNHFRQDLPQYDNSASSPFVTATDTTNEIVGAALGLLSGIYRQGILYKRGGVMVSAISSAASVQPDLFEFDPERRGKYSAVSKALDAINRDMGDDTVVLASQQYIQPGGKDGMKFSNAIRRAMKSPDYTTRLGAFRIP